MSQDGQLLWQDVRIVVVFRACFCQPHAFLQFCDRWAGAHLANLTAVKYALHTSLAAFFYILRFPTPIMLLDCICGTWLALTIEPVRAVSVSPPVFCIQRFVLSTGTTSFSLHSRTHSFLRSGVDYTQFDSQPPSNKGQAARCGYS